jgi:hypothetical protein
MEKSVPIKGSPGYTISITGRVFCARSNEVVRQWLDKDGYCKVTIYWPAKKGPKNFSVHRLVAEAFLEPRPSGCAVAHNDGKKWNNCVENLRWATQKSNIGDKVLHGTQLNGEAMHLAKLRDKNIPVMRGMREAGATWDQIGRAFGVSRVAARNAVTGKTWKHVSLSPRV